MQSIPNPSYIALFESDIWPVRKPVLRVSGDDIDAHCEDESHEQNLGMVINNSIFLQRNA